MFQNLYEIFYINFQQYRKGEWNINDIFLKYGLKTLEDILCFQTLTVILWFCLFYGFYDSNIYFYTFL